MAELTPEDEATLRRLLGDALKKPPMIGLVGVSGVGKSSTINAMFKTSLPISHTQACTTKFREVPLQLQIAQGPAEGHGVQLIVCDAPGLGEDSRKDPEYLDMYRRKLPECDMILWIMTARNRAIALDQSYLRHFLDLQERIVFAINQVDLVEPMNWKPGFPIPSEEQERNITEIIKDRGQRLSDFLGRKIEITPYSNKHGYHLEWLFTNLLQSCTGNRSWIFSGLKKFNYTDFVPTEVDIEASIKAKHESQPFWKKVGEWFSPPSRSENLLPQRKKKIIGRIIGREDIDSHPMSDDELRLLEAWLKQAKWDSLDNLKDG